MAYQCRRGVVSVPSKKGPHARLECVGLFDISGVIRTSGYPSETRYRSTMSNLGDHTHHRLSFKAFFHASLKPFRDTVPFV